jgi:hypothetical protein
VRFSNGNPDLQHDLRLDVRGMAIKLPEVPGDFFPQPGNGQDFVLATAEAFFGTEAVDYVDFIDASRKISTQIRYFIKPHRWRGWLQLFRSLRVPPSPLALDYFSQTPYRLGPHCVKYGVRPIGRRSGRHDPWYMRPVIRHVLSGISTILRVKLPKRIPCDAVREALIGDLARDSFAFEFMVQRWPDLGQLPPWAIENATRTWPAPWTRVGVLEIPSQGRIPDRDAAAERMTFSPWHALRVHKPLGSINRARLAIYQTMSTFRNAHNP